MIGAYAEQIDKTWKMVSVQCDPSTIDDTRCHISDAVRLNVGDRIAFDTMSNSDADKILEFSITYDANITLLPHGIFEKFQHLEQLQMSTGLRHLHHDNFEHAWNLWNLTLSDNKIEHIESATFARAINLVELNLDGNEILHLDNDAFIGLDKLYYLSLNKNRLITLKSYVFVGARHLTDLRLAHNAIEVLEPGVFDLPDLMFLYLGNNQLKTLPADCFASTQLIGLDLDANKLEHLGDAIYKLKMIRRLILTRNDLIDDLNVTRLNEMKHLQQFTVSKNVESIE